jgi:tRNA(Ser,Leu) C12 N-acetylase TAN1
MRRALKKIVSDPKKLFKRAIRQQRAATAKKLLKGVSLATVGIARKIEIEKKLDKMKNRIKTLARKLLPGIKKDEKNKLKKKVV